MAPGRFRGFSSIVCHGWLSEKKGKQMGKSCFFVIIASNDFKKTGSLDVVVMFFHSSMLVVFETLFKTSKQCILTSL